MLYFTGDTHGNLVERFSYAENPSLRNVGEADTIFILGDFGCRFGINLPAYKQHDEKRDTYNLNFLAARPWTTIALAGNHDDRDYIRTLPIVIKYGAQMRQVADNIFYIDTPQVVRVEGETILCIPGADSHDIDDGILDPEHPDFKYIYNEYRKAHKQFRIKHWTWWEDEGVDIAACKKLLERYPARDSFTLILSHDSPAIFDSLGLDYSGFRLNPTESQRYLDLVRTSYDADVWMHGHRHINYPYKDPYNKVGTVDCMCIYEDILKLEE